MVAKKKSEELSVYDQATLPKEKFVVMKKGSETVKVVKTAFDRVWSDLGWTLAKDGADVTGGLTAVDDRNSEDHEVKPTKENAS